LNDKLFIGVASPVIIMARTYRISLWDCRTDSDTRYVMVPDNLAFNYRRDGMDIDVKLRHDDDLAHAEDEIRHALADF